MTASFNIVVAVDSRLGIGKNGALPWRLKEDMAFFKKTTSAGTDPVVIMGRKTWESIPEKFRPLPNRRNIVLTRNKEYETPEGVARFNSLGVALQSIDGDNVFVIGGGEIYETALSHPSCKGIYMTSVDGDFNCDTKFPEIGYNFIRTKEIATGKEDGVSYRISYLVRQ